MRGYIEYKSKIKGDCPTDISLSGLDDDEVKFLQWSAELQGTVSRIGLSLKYYNAFLNKYFPSRHSKKNKCFLTYILSNICVSLSIDLGKLCSNKNELSIKHYITECRNQPNIFNDDIQGVCNKCDGIYKQLYILYRNKIQVPRNKVYGHSDVLLLNFDEVDKVISNVSIDDMNKMLEMSKEIVSSIWYAYNHHDMCFEFKNQNDYRKILLLI